MELAVITEYFTKYGAVAIFVMVFLEYLNLPGFPAGVIMPMAGGFVAKLLPAVRTLISLPAGAMKMNLWKYIVSSAAGIFLWNLVFIGAGYLLGEAV